MSRRRGTASLGASPVLIGAATVLVALVAVFIAYNANAGLPFVPDLRPERRAAVGRQAREGERGPRRRLPGGRRQGHQAEAHDGERRAPQRGRRRAQSRQEDRAAQPRHPVPRASALGSRAQVHRASARHEQGHVAVRRHGSGQAVLRAARVRGPLLDLRPRDPPQHPEGHRRLRQRLRRPRPGDQPVDPGAQPVLQGADTGDAEPVRSGHRARPSSSSRWAGRPRRWRRLPKRRRCCSPTWRTPSRPSPPTRARSRTRSRRARRRWTSRSTRFRVQRPFMVDFTDLSARLRPAAEQLPRSLPAINSALRGRHAGAAADGRAERQPREGLQRGERPVREPEHAARPEGPHHRGHGHPPGARVHRALPDGLQLLQLLHAPAGRDAVGGPDGPHGRRHGPEPEHEAPELASAEQLRSSTGSRPWDILPGQKPQGAKDLQGNPLFRLYATAYNPAIDAQGNADCQLGQTGYPNGALGPGRYKPVALKDQSEEHGLPIPEEVGSGTNGAITENDLPGLSGGTYKSRELGIDNLKDVP